MNQPPTFATHRIVTVLSLLAIAPHLPAAAPAPAPPPGPEDPKRFQKIAEWTLTIRKREASYDTSREGEGNMLHTTNRNGLNMRGEGDLQLQVQGSSPAMPAIPADKLALMKQLGMTPPTMPGPGAGKAEIWTWEGEGKGTLFASDRYVNVNMVNGRVFEGTERDADGETPVVLKLAINFTKGTYTASCDGTPGPKMLIMPPKMRIITPVALVVTEVNVNPEGDRLENRLQRTVNFTMRDEPLPAKGLEISGVVRKPLKERGRVVGYEELSWRLAPKSKIPRVYIEFPNEAYMPEPNTSVDVRIRWTEGTPTKIVFKLGAISKEPGTCLNSADTGTGADVEFTAGQAGLKISGVTASADGPVRGVKLNVHDYGAYAEVRAVVMFGAAQVVAVSEVTGKDFVSVPHDENDNHIADVWEHRFESLGLPPAWDEDAYPKQPLLKGDGITLYEEYRGFLLKGGVHTRLDPRRMELFFVDPEGLLDVKLFENATNLHVLQLDDTQHQNLRVDFNSPGTRKPKYAVRFTRVSGMADPQIPGEMYVWGNSDGVVADEPVNCRVYETRIQAALTSDLRGRIQAALAEPDGDDAVRFREVGADPTLLRRALQALDDPGKVADVVKRIVRWVAIHELCHVCDIDHHKPAADAGERTCPVRNASKEEKLYGLPRELLLQTGSGMPFGVSKLCQSGDNCWLHLRLRPR